MQTMNLTLMEEQVLEIFRVQNIAQYEDASLALDKSFYATSSKIARIGRQMYGPNWGGAFSSSQGSSAWKSYPTINRFLGRLQKKELLTRFDSDIAPYLQRSFGSWGLTAEGWELLGLPDLDSE